MENITVIIPLHIYDEEVKKYLDRSIGSVFYQEGEYNIIIVAPENITTLVSSDFKNEKIKYITNEGETDYCSQVNLGAKNCETKYFSILGFDDYYHKNWFRNVYKYITNNPEYSAYFPIVNYIDTDDTYIGTVNEIIWSMAFADDATSEQLGKITHKTLEGYYDISTNGGVFRVDDFIESGMLKPSIKLSFWYEYLLRSTSQNMKFYVIPKNGYFQTVNREGSMLSDTNKEMDQRERSWWLKLATKEFYFKQERKKQYNYIPEKSLSEIEGLTK